jgi:hypothetical protein
MASTHEAAARRAAEELLAAAAAEPIGAEAARGDAAPAAPRPRVLKALDALQSALLDAGPAAAEAALGVDGLVPALLREAAGPADPSGEPDCVEHAVACLSSLAKAADGPPGAGPASPRAAALLSAALRRDPACLLHGMARAAARQAAARGAGVAGPAGSSGAPPAAASLAAVAPGEQLYLMLHLARAHLLGGSGLGAGAPALSFARSGDAVAAALEALLHGCPRFLEDARAEAASAIQRLCCDPQTVPHLRGSFPRIVPALVRRLEPGAPFATPAEQLNVLLALSVRQGRTLLDQGRVLLAVVRGICEPRAAARDTAERLKLLCSLAPGNMRATTLHPTVTHPSRVSPPARDAGDHRFRGGHAAPVRRRLLRRARPRVGSRGRPRAEGRPGPRIQPGRAHGPR